MNEIGFVGKFEYCYRIQQHEYSLRWQDGRGFECARIDDGEASPLRNDTPISIESEELDKAFVLKHFREEGLELDSSVYQFVLRKLFEFKQKSS